MIFMFDVDLSTGFDAVLVEFFLLGNKCLRRRLRWREQHTVLRFSRDSNGTQLVREPGGRRFSGCRQSGQLEYRDLKPAELLPLAANFDNLFLQRELARQAIEADRPFWPPPRVARAAFSELPVSRWRNAPLSLSLN